jgi:glutathione S-transferase
MTDLVLYHALFSTCSQKVRFALAAKGLDYDSRIVDLTRNEHLQDDYLALNPNGVVPTLVDRGTPIVDSSVICEYLDDAYPAVSLTPADPVRRAAMRTWMRYFEEVTTPAIRAPSYNALFAPGIHARGEAVNRAARERMPLRRRFYEKLGPNGFDAAIIEESVERLDASLARVEAALADGRAFILGADLTIADVTLMPSVVRLDDIGMASMWDNRPAVAQWFARMQAHRAYAATYSPGSRPGDAGMNPASRPHTAF